MGLKSVMARPTRITPARMETARRLSDWSVNPSVSGMPPDKLESASNVK